MQIAVKFEFHTSNNGVECKTLTRPKMIVEMGAQRVILYTDSRLVAQQIKREYLDKDKSMMLYVEKVVELRNKFQTFEVQ